MKSDDKRIAIITVVAIILLALLFSCAPTLKERTEKFKQYSKKYQEEQTQEKQEDSPFKAQFMSWDDRKEVLYIDYYFMNQQNVAVESVNIECHTFDEKRRELDKLKKKFLIKMKPNSTESFSSLKMGKISKKTEQVGCAVTNYK